MRAKGHHTNAGGEKEETKRYKNQEKERKGEKAVLLRNNRENRGAGVLATKRTQHGKTRGSAMTKKEGRAPCLRVLFRRKERISLYRGPREEAGPYGDKCSFSYNKKGSFSFPAKEKLRPTL